MSRIGRGVTTDEEPESVIESRRDLIRRENADPRCRQLDGQWDAVELTAYLRDGNGHVLGDLEAAIHTAGSIGEELHSGRGSDFAERRTIGRDPEVGKFQQAL